jgi:hypothetical protein
VFICLLVQPNKKVRKGFRSVRFSSVQFDAFFTIYVFTILYIHLAALSLSKEIGRCGLTAHLQAVPELKIRPSVPPFSVGYFVPWVGDKTRVAKLEVFTVVTMKNGVFWDVTPCDFCKNRRFEEI